MASEDFLRGDGEGAPFGENSWKIYEIKSRRSEINLIL